jgi:hypothetical protein
VAFRAGANGCSTPTCRCCAPIAHQTPPRAKRLRLVDFHQAKQVTEEPPGLLLAAGGTSNLHVVETNDAHRQRTYRAIAAPARTSLMSSLEERWTDHHAALADGIAYEQMNGGRVRSVRSKITVPAADVNRAVFALVKVMVPGSNGFPQPAGGLPLPSDSGCVAFQKVPSIFAHLMPQCV